MLASKRLHHCNLRLRDLFGIDAGHAHSAAVNLHHNPMCIGLGAVKNLLKDKHDEIHRGVVVVVEQDLIHRRFPGLLLRPLDYSGIGLFLSFTQNY